MRGAVLGVLASVAACGYDICDEHRDELEGVLQDRSSIAVHFSSGARVSGERVEAYARGYLFNRREDTPCAAAMLRYDGVPNREDVPSLDEHAPLAEMLPDGAILLFDEVLPPAGRYERRYHFYESIADRHLGDATIDRTYVLLVCADPQVEFELATSIRMCMNGNDPPARDPEAVMKRLW